VLVTHVRVGLAAIAILAVVGCTPAHVNRSTSRSAPAVHRVVQTAAPNSVVVAATVDVNVVLYRVGLDRVARSIATLLPPSTGAPFAAQEIALTAGGYPDACVLWGTQHEQRLLCYPFGGNPSGVLEATVDTTKDTLQGISLRGDGTRIAWIEAPHLSAIDDSSNDRVLVTAQFSHGALASRRQELVYPNRQNRGTPCQWPFETSWTGHEQVLLSCSGDNDANGGYVTVDVPLRGHGTPLVEHHSGRFNQYVGLRAYTPTEAVGVENEYCDITCPDGKAPEAGRAVRVNLRTGAVTEVLGYAAPRRDVISVLGGNDGVVYVTAPTSGHGPIRTYLRLPADPHGKRITGLGGDVLAAQP
jgi:hypothetical protein